MAKPRTKMMIPKALLVLVLVILFISIEAVPANKLTDFESLCLICCEQGPQNCYAYNICSNTCERLQFGSHFNWSSAHDSGPKTEEADMKLYNLDQPDTVA